VGFKRAAPNPILRREFPFWLPGHRAFYTRPPPLGAVLDRFSVLEARSGTWGCRCLAWSAKGIAGWEPSRAIPDHLPVWRGPLPSRSIWF